MKIWWTSEQKTQKLPKKSQNNSQRFVVEAQKITNKQRHSSKQGRKLTKP